MDNSVELLLPGFPGKSSLSFLGWSSVVYIKNNEKNILFDTGNFGARKILLNKLNQLNINPCDINYVILSHLHFDHCINLPLFKNATIIYNELELEYEDGLKPEGVIDFIRDTPKKVLIRNDEEIFEGISVINTPGHTPGSISLVIKEKDKTYVLAADAAKNLQELSEEKPDMSMNYSDSVLSIQKIKKAAEFIIPGHDHILHLRQDGILTREHPLQVVIELPKGIREGKKERFVIEV